MKFQLLLFFSTLATSQARVVKRIIGGTNAERDSLPNMVSLQVYENDPQVRVHVCGGTIVNQWWILISGKCATEIKSGDRPKETFRVCAGKWNLSEFEKNQQIRRIKEAYPHPQFFVEMDLSYDIGLVELSVALVLNEFVKTFPLSTKLDYPSGIAIIAGWGSAYLNEIMSHISTNILQVMKVVLATHQECLIELQKLLEENNEVFEKDMFDEHIFCSGSFTSTKGSSFHDSGNPLMQSNESDGYDVVGVTIASGGPTLYLHVTPLLDWINATMNMA